MSQKLYIPNLATSYNDVALYKLQATFMYVCGAWPGLFHGYTVRDSRVLCVQQHQPHFCTRFGACRPTNNTDKNQLHRTDSAVPICQWLSDMGRSWIGSKLASGRNPVNGLTALACPMCGEYTVGV